LVAIVPCRMKITGESRQMTVGKGRKSKENGRR
jgi:hypothetical protein